MSASKPLLVLLALTGLAAPARAQGAVEVYPGDDLQALVDAHLPGTRFLVREGVHRNQQVWPKDGDVFSGEPGAVLSGAWILTGWSYEAPYWTLGGQTAQGQVHGKCAEGYEGCRYPEDLFLDDRPLRHETSLEQLDSPGEWYFDYEMDKIYLLEDPGGARVELGSTPHAFTGTARNVTIENLTVEKYASPAQKGAIHGRDGSGWIVRDSDVRLNHGMGIRTGEGMQVIRNRIERNGQLGVGGFGDGVRIEENWIRENNYAGFNWMWEAGGAKIVLADGVTFRMNRVESNVGPGLWTDIDTINVLYESNVVQGNAYSGIMHEISHDATIRGNWLAENGVAFDSWLWGAQILVSTSRNTEVYDNSVIVAAQGGHGIGLVQQECGAGIRGPRRTENNWVHDNTIIYLGDRGYTGGDADYDLEGMFAAGNRFESNSYRGTNLSEQKRWLWGGTWRNWREWQAGGQDLDGSIPVGRRRCGLLGIEPLVLPLLAWRARRRRRAHPASSHA